MHFFLQYGVAAPSPMLMYSAHTCRFSLGTSLYLATSWQSIAVQIGYPADLSKASRLVLKKKSLLFKEQSFFLKFGEN
jgi:hypothetical protein